MYFILFVLHDISKLQDILNAWEDAGVKGITMLFTTGLGRIRQNFGFMEDFPIFPSMSDIMDRLEVLDLSRTLFSVVDSMEIVDRVLDVTQNITGDLNTPDTGIMIILPVVKVYGLRTHKPQD